MRDRSGKAFGIAVVLHLLLFALLFTGYLVSPRDPEPLAQTLELFAPPSQTSEVTAAPPEPERPVRQIELPEFEFQEVELPPTEPRPRPEPQPQPEPQPRPEPRPEQPRPEPEPQAERISLAEFRQQHGTPTTPQPRPQPTPQPRQIQAPRIDTSRISRELQSVMSSTTDQELVSRLSDSDQRELERYFARLRVAIERSWNRPSSATTGMSATVRFSLSSQGRITGAQVVRSSGSDAFDRSIVEAFERLASFDPPPDGQSYTPNLTFRVD